MPSPHPRPVALITGAARRVGAVIARVLHAAGFDLALHHRHSTADITALCAELEARRPGSTLVLQAELGESGAVERIAAKALDHYGRVDALVNNASTFFPTRLGSITDADWETLFASNARAPLFLAQALAPALRANRGAIVNLVDIYAERPLTGHTVYCMAKAALLMMTQSLARDLAPDVRVNAVAPGAVMWPEAGKSDTEQQALIARTPLARAGVPEDVAAAVRYLLCDAPYVTGQVIRVDGGRSLML
jgi:pteridine reductase